MKFPDDMDANVPHTPGNLSQAKEYAVYYSKNQAKLAWRTGVNATVAYQMPSGIIAFKGCSMTAKEFSLKGYVFVGYITALTLSKILTKE